ncbi:hypothetical protein ACFO0M_10235 [Micromonospora mangrovi]|uniref:DUF2637 domain-containing protein n=2 Tax=Micromonospora TaxID=1873 RepID=A0AAU8HE26_9ACTN
MKLISRTPRLSPAELAQLETARIRAEDERRRLAADFARDQAAAAREERRRTEREHVRAERKRRKAREKARARRRRQLAHLATTGRTVAPLLVVNAATVGGQLAYTYDQTPATWPTPVRVAVAVGVATAAESVALYVGWHAHDALLKRAYGTAARLRRASYAIALVMAAVNYSHFTKGPLDPTALAVILGVLSSLSPWLWGLHTRRAQHVQLVREDLVDETGAVFGPDRRRAFPVRSWQARRWSIDNNVRDPKMAWNGYKAEREAKRAAARPGRWGTAWAGLRGRAEVVRSTPAPVDENDPGIRQCRKVQREMAAARESIMPRLARIVLADRLANLRPAGGQPIGQAGGQRVNGGRPPAAPDPDGQQPVPPPSAPEPPPPPADSATARVAAAYDELVAELRRPPSGRQVARRAGVSKTTANDWLNEHRRKQGN